MNYTNRPFEKQLRITTFDALKDGSIKRFYWSLIYCAVGIGITVFHPNDLIKKIGTGLAVGGMACATLPGAQVGKDRGFNKTSITMLNPVIKGIYEYVVPVSFAAAALFLISPISAFTITCTLMITKFIGESATDEMILEKIQQIKIRLKQEGIDEKDFFDSLLKNAKELHKTQRQMEKDNIVESVFDFNLADLVIARRIHEVWSKSHKES